MGSEDGLLTLYASAYPNTVASLVDGADPMRGRVCACSGFCCCFLCVFGTQLCLLAMILVCICVCKVSKGGGCLTPWVGHPWGKGGVLHPISKF